jgi:hypothetical protein
LPHTIAVTRLDGIWRVERESGVLPPYGVSKRIFGTGGWTLVAGVPVAHFRVQRPDEDRAVLDYLALPVRDELEALDDGWAGRGLVFGREICRFRLVRAPA